jgi:hypothetical protein
LKTLSKTLIFQKVVFLSNNTRIESRYFFYFEKFGYFSKSGGFQYLKSLVITCRTSVQASQPSLFRVGPQHGKAIWTCQSSLLIITQKPLLSMPQNKPMPLSATL